MDGSADDNQLWLQLLNATSTISSNQLFRPSLSSLGAPAMHPLLHSSTEHTTSQFHAAPGLVASAGGGATDNEIKMLLQLQQQQQQQQQLQLLQQQQRQQRLSTSVSHALRSNNAAGVDSSTSNFLQNYIDHQLGQSSQQQRRHSSLGADLVASSTLLQKFLDQQKAQSVTSLLELSRAHQNPGVLPNSSQPLLQPSLLREYPMLLGGNRQLGLSSLATANNAGPAVASLPTRNMLLVNQDDGQRTRGGIIEPFPEKLHRLLCEVEAVGRTDIISFVQGGLAFSIHRPDNFFNEIVPHYFRQSRLSSFKRQLHLYGFELIGSGPARGAYFHQMFRRDRPELARQMRRAAVKVQHAKSSKKDDSDDNESEGHEGANMDTKPAAKDAAVGRRRGGKAAEGGF